LEGITQRKKNMIVIDTETTGLDPHRHQMVSIAARHIDSGAVFSVYIRLRPGVTVDLSAMMVHCLTAEELEARGVPESLAMLQFEDWLKGLGPQDWCGCNPQFDLGFLLAAFGRAGMRASLSRRPVCVQTLAWMAHRMGKIVLPWGGDGLCSRSLDSILKALGLSRRGATHDAVEDVELTGTAFRRLTLMITSGPAMVRPGYPLDWRDQVERMFPEIVCPDRWHELPESVRNSVLDRKQGGV